MQNHGRVVPNHTSRIFATRLKKFWGGFGTKIDPRSRKSGSEIFTKIKSIFNQIFNRFWLHFGPHGPPQNSRFFIDFWSWCRSWAILAPRGCPKCSRAAPEVNFPRIWYHFGVDFERFFNDFRTFFNTTSRLISPSMLPFLQH